MNIFVRLLRRLRLERKGADKDCRRATCRPAGVAMDGRSSQGWNTPVLRWCPHHRQTHPHRRSLRT